MLRAALAVLVLGAVLGSAAGLAATKPPPRNPARLQVTAKEFWFGLSRRTLKPGPAIVQLVNFGEDPHDLRLRRVGGTRVYRTPEVGPGDVYDLEATLPAGTYELWCAIADHRSRGMRATVTVK